MMDLVCEKIADGRVLYLIESFLKSGIMNDGIFEESIEGTPQGGNLSPLLSNICLNHFDRRMGDYGYLLLRYADDIVIFCKFESDAQDALKRANSDAIDKKSHIIARFIVYKAVIAFLVQ